MKFHPKISIIIPVYNGANYLEAAVRSALAQTYDNFEILVVNDGSNDSGKTADLAKRLQKENPNIIRYFEKPNGGVASALNLGISQMKGELFSWLSHDDMYKENKLEAQVNVLSQLDESDRLSTVVYSDFDVINALSKKTGSVRFSEKHSPEKLNLSLYPLVNGLIHGCSLLIPADVLRKHSGFDESLKHTQDYDLWLRILPNLQVRYLPEALIMSRAHGEQDSMKVSENERREKEVSDLWINIFQSVTHENRIRLEGSETKFFRKMLALVRSEKVPKAHSFILEKWQSRKVSEPSKVVHAVSVIVPLYSDSLDLDASLQSISEQSYGNREVIVLEISGEADLQLTERWQDKNLNVRVVSAQGELVNGLRIACEHSTGSRIAFLASGSRFDPEKLARQNEYMNLGPYPIVSTSYIDCGSSNARKVFVSNGDLIAGTSGEMFKNQSAVFSTVLVEKDVLIALLDGRASNPGLLLWRIAKRFSFRNLDLPLSYVLQTRSRAFEVNLRDFGVRERLAWTLFNLKESVRSSYRAGYKLLKVAIFQRLPFRMQIQIRRLLLRI